jgi:hypothetical protein
VDPDDGGQKKKARKPKSEVDQERNYVWVDTVGERPTYSVSTPHSYHYPNSNQYPHYYQQASMFARAPVNQDYGPP